jgi:hypothetical protein
MGWELIQTFELTTEWQFTQPVEGNLFRLRYPDQPTIARAEIAQTEITDEIPDFFETTRINANQRKILEFKKPYCFTERRIALKQIYGEYQWDLSLEVFMPINNVPTVQQVASINTIATSVDARVALTAGTAATVLAANASRKDAVMTLETSGVDVFIRRGASTGLTPTSGAILLTGKGASFSIDPSNMYTGVISAVCASAAVLNVTEGS